MSMRLIEEKELMVSNDDMKLLIEWIKKIDERLKRLETKKRWKVIWWDDCISPLILCECEDGKVPTTYIYQTTSVKCKISQIGLI